MMRLRTVFFLMAAGLVTICAAAEQQPPPVRIDQNGTVHVTEFSVPLSSYMSEEAKQSLIRGSQDPGDPAWDQMDVKVEKLRALQEDAARGQLERAKARYPVNIEERTIGGVHTRVITPKAGVAPGNKTRVLIELHSGGFFSGATNAALTESIPVAGVGGFKVIAVDYREGPENRFPAASEDVARVYKELLKDHSAAAIGLFGYAAGGTLTAMSVSWFQKEKLPVPGAIGIFSAGAFGNFDAPPGVRGAWGGDSRYVTAPLVGDPPLSADPLAIPKLPTVMTVYMHGVDLSDPLASPALWPAVLAKFPPALILTTTRGFDMSAAVQTHRELVKAGVAAELHVWDGLPLGSLTDVDLPEARESFAVIGKFFDQRLSR